MPASTGKGKQKSSSKSSASTSGSQKNPELKYNSFEELMAQRYPQPNKHQKLASTVQKSASSKMSSQYPSFSSTNRPTGIPTYLNKAKSTTTPKAGTGKATGSNTKSSKGSSTGSTRKDSSRSSTATPGGITFNTPQQKQNLAQCDWKDKIIWASRLILGGNSINGFLRATATAQRVKKQRARQLTVTKKTAAAAAAAAGSRVDTGKKENAKKPFDQEEEERLKADILNPRTAKRIKAEMEAGLQFCASVHNLLRSVLFEVDPAQAPYLPPAFILEEEKPPAPPPIPSALVFGSGPPKMVPQQPQETATSRASTTDSTMPWAVKPNALGGPHQVKQASIPQGSAPRRQSSKTTASPGNEEGSTSRKQRKKKLPASSEPALNLPEFDASGKRLCTKKEHHYRIVETLRFRALRQGDFVAARLSSRDLWILARVLKDYAGTNLAPLDFLQLSGSRRDAAFREQVLVKDVEDKEDGGYSQVNRNLILPLPRTYSEAAEWGQRIKKGSRVYAMYPQTTSLYSATVIDSTTYCRGDDDIMVVEFDGEEHDATGQVPKYHIPARFVTLIPREFSASNAAANKNKRKGAPTPAAPNTAKRQHKPDNADMMLMGFGGDGLGNFDALDLDFDKPLSADEEGGGFMM